MKQCDKQHSNTWACFIKKNLKKWSKFRIEWNSLGIEWTLKMMFFAMLVGVEYNFIVKR